ncbi:hypothetical protein HHK36_029918 [Tetracentron sinense]|uniref:DUF4378 domain-containing protein n=1 Tax=Tetracentron sinense TaxID=13715 RepID=A0A834YBR3_TETSI|nr:hypothetical protein HHK36_029918 [Tetracentron sinense]
MSAKLLHALTDDNPDLQKQLGCMTGIFQIFDRHHIVTGRRINGHSHKRLPSGHSHFNSGNLGMELNKEKDLKKNVKEHQRVSTESSRASFSSSSCSSSFSSLDCNKTAQPEQPFFNQAIFPETPSRDLPVSHKSASPQLGRQSFDLRDAVKDSIYRDVHGLSVKTTTKEEAVSYIMKHRDSPRPLQLSKSVDGSYGVEINGKAKVPVDLKESLRVLAKLREAPWYFNEAREPPRSPYEAKDGSFHSVPKDAPRFSYDGRELHRRSFESRDTFKSTTKLKELPRLSLDSREGSMRGYNSDSKSNFISRDLQRGSGNSNNRIPDLQQELGNQKRPPSVVAKLMGLEALPDSISVTEGQMGLIKTYPGEDRNSFSKSSKTRGECKQNQNSGSPRNSYKDPASPRLRNPDSVMKPISMFPIEPAPWRQTDGGRGYQKPASRNREAPAREPKSPPSVYLEIEKRLKELEFKHSNKDLRALKQILEAMQGKGLLETKKEDQASNFVSQRKYKGMNYTNLDQNPRLANQRNSQNYRPTSAKIKGASSPRTIESPIVIMKPAKLVEKSRIPASSLIPIEGLTGLRKLRSSDSTDSRNGLVNNRTAKDVSPKNNLRDPATRALNSMDKKINGRTLISMQTSTKPQHLPRENTTSSGRSSGSVSPRLQQKKLELEKRYSPPIPSSDSSKPRRQSSRQPTESGSGSPGGKRRPKSPNLQQSDDQLSEISSETRNLSHQGDEISLRSESSISLASQIDTEVTSAYGTAESNSIVSQQYSKGPSRKVANYSVSCLKQEKPTPRLSEAGPLAELATSVPEQPSPVSVLDASFYRDDLPSPVKKISIAFPDDETQNLESPGEGRWSPVDQNHLSDKIRPNLSSEINRKKLDNIDHLVQKLRRLNSNHDETATDYIASLCKNTNPDHRYISEILLASGLLLRDLGSSLTTIQLHPSGHPINPDLFFVLEQTKASTTLPKDEYSCKKVARSKPDQEKLHRKFIFDAVNEILVQKLALVAPFPKHSFRPDKLAGRNRSGQQILRELCSEIEQLQANNSDCSLEDEDDSLKSILREDVMHRSENWTDFGRDVSGLVLDVERLVFKDLVDEIVCGEVASMRGKLSRHCRKLFAK